MGHHQGLLVCMLHCTLPLVLLRVVILLVIWLEHWNRVHYPCAIHVGIYIQFMKCISVLIYISHIRP
jgi:hypothetical protein